MNKNKIILLLLILIIVMMVKSIPRKNIFKIYIKTKKATKPINKLIKKTKNKLTVFVIETNTNYLKYSDEDRYILETIMGLLF